jgi:hypothetical protein
MHVLILTILMLKRASLICLLAFALLIQNTCPMGAAGKSSVVPTCPKCPLMQNVIAPSDHEHKLVSDLSSIHFPMFVFSVPKTIPVFQLAFIKASRAVPANGYQDALPDELLRPPQA